MVDKMVYRAASHGEVQAVADVLGKIGEDVPEVWMVAVEDADMASLRRLASRLLHDALGTGLASQVYTILHGLEMKKVPLVIHVVKQESHRAGVGNHEPDGADKQWTRSRNQNEGCRRERSTSTWYIYHQGWGTRREPDGWWRTGAEGSYECTHSQRTC